MNERSSSALASQVVEWALSKKAEDLSLLDLRGLADVADHFVIATGFSEIQIQAITDAVVEGAEAVGETPLHVEGREFGRWVLIDFVDVVVHVMLPEERERYRLDRLWGDAPCTTYDETGAVIESTEGLRDGEDGATGNRSVGS